MMTSPLSKIVEGTRWTVRAKKLYPPLWRKTGERVEIARRLTKVLKHKDVEAEMLSAISDFVHHQLPPRRRWTAVQEDCFGDLERALLACELGIPWKALVEDRWLFAFIKRNHLHLIVRQHPGQHRIGWDSVDGVYFAAVLEEGAERKVWWKALKPELKHSENDDLKRYTGGLYGLGHKYCVGAKGIVQLPDLETERAATWQAEKALEDPKPERVQQQIRQLMDVISCHGDLLFHRDRRPPPNEDQWLISIKCEAGEYPRTRGDHAWLVFETPNGDAMAIGLYRSRLTFQVQEGRVVLADAGELWTSRGGTRDELTLAFDAETFLRILLRVLKDHQKEHLDYSVLDYNCLDYALERLEEGDQSMHFPVHTSPMQYAFPKLSPKWGDWLMQHIPLLWRGIRRIMLRLEEGEPVLVTPPHWISGVSEFRKVQESVRLWREKQIARLRSAKDGVPLQEENQLRYYALPKEYVQAGHPREIDADKLLDN